MAITYLNIKVKNPQNPIFLLGAVTLKSLGVILDPINRELKPLSMLM